MTTRDRAVAIAQRWLLRADINPNGELALVAQELINAVNEGNASPERVVELPSWPFHQKGANNDFSL